MKKNILITGGAGFIGSNFIEYFINQYPNYHLINLDNLSYAGDLNNLIEVQHQPNYQFVQGDICDLRLINEIFTEHFITDVIHFAAESHVDNSISHPDIFIQTNINGSFNLIHTAYKNWFNAPFDVKKEFQDSRFHHISTDEVYGSLGETGYFTETTPYAPNSPYSASKAASDMIVRSYHHTYGMNTVISNCSNNYGMKQHDEKLIPTIIRNAIQGKPIPIYGDGKNIRDWLFVQDHCDAIDLVFHKSKTGETYNIGGNNELDNNTIACLICETLDKIQPKSISYKEQITYVQDRFGHDARYAIDASKIKTELNWEAKQSLQDGIEKTINWYLGKYL